MKKQILLLSEEKWSFLNMPEDTEYMQDWEYEFNPALAQALMKADPKLNRMRFLLVPYKIKEDPFWKNYFARVYIIKCTIMDPSVIPRARISKPVEPQPSQIDPFSAQVKKLKEVTVHSPSINTPTTEENMEQQREEQLKKELADLGEDFDLDIDLDIDLDANADDSVLDFDDPELELLLNS